MKDGARVAIQLGTQLSAWHKRYKIGPIFHNLFSLQTHARTCGCNLEAPVL